MFASKKQLKALMEWLGIGRQDFRIPFSPRSLTEKIESITKQHKLELEGDFCSECGGFFKKDKLQKVVVTAEYVVYIDGGSVEFGRSVQTNSHFYCPTHAKPYDKQIGDKYYKSEVEVDEKGKVIK